jgi:hypothetical protein
MTLGSYTLEDGAKGCIRLSRTKWREAVDGDWLAIAEGCEDALTIIPYAPSLRVAAGVSLSAMKKTWIPNVLNRVLLITQNDPPGSPAALLFPKVCERFRCEGRELQLLKLHEGVKDVNELAMRLRAFGGGSARTAQSDAATRGSTGTS